MTETDIKLPAEIQNQLLDIVREYKRLGLEQKAAAYVKSLVTKELEAASLKLDSLEALINAKAIEYRAAAKEALFDIELSPRDWDVKADLEKGVSLIRKEVAEVVKLREVPKE